MKLKNKYYNNLIITTCLWLAFELVVIRQFNLYETLPHIDLVTHFLFGIALTYFLLWKRIKKEYRVLFILIISLAWELIEKIGDNIIEQPNYLLDYFWFDGIIDTIMHFVGYYFIIKYIEKKI